MTYDNNVRDTCLGSVVYVFSGSGFVYNDIYLDNGYISVASGLVALVGICLAVKGIIQDHRDKKSSDQDSEVV